MYLIARLNQTLQYLDVFTLISPIFFPHSDQNNKGIEAKNKILKAKRLS